MLKLIIIFLFSIFTQIAICKELVKIKDLSGYWKFSIGDLMAKKEPSFNDNDWDKIKASDCWENQGYNGYDGIAWYRTSFKSNILPDNKKIYLQLGFIDDADEVYLNGKLIGYSGKFPPFPRTAYRAFREYFIPNNYLKKDGSDNVIAVRVYDQFYNGGFTGGKVGLYYDKNAIKMAIDLEGVWKFKKGNNKNWIYPDLNDSKWEPILTPLFWDYQGLKHFDGNAFYRKTIFISKNLAQEALYLYLGKIDDFDEVYFNGVLIGTTRDNKRFGQSQSYQEIRRYKIPIQVIKEDDYNNITVKVMDIGHNGGIYEGPLGIHTH